MEKAEKQYVNVSHKSFLIILKYIPYIIAFGYAISTIGDFFECDFIGLGYMFHLSITSWVFMLLASFVFKYCKVHRLPLYYIAINEILNVTDYYIGIPISVIHFLILHLLIIFLFISLYIYIYVKDTKKSFTTNS